MGRMLIDLLNTLGVSVCSYKQLFWSLCQPVKVTIGPTVPPDGPQSCTTATWILRNLNATHQYAPNPAKLYCFARVNGNCRFQIVRVGPDAPLTVILHGLGHRDTSSLLRKENAHQPFCILLGSKVLLALGIGNPTALIQMRKGLFKFSVISSGWN